MYASHKLCHLLRSEAYCNLVQAMQFWAATHTSGDVLLPAKRVGKYPVCRLQSVRRKITEPNLRKRLFVFFLSFFLGKSPVSKKRKQELERKIQRV